MTTHDHPVWQLLDQMQMDLRQLSARMVELRAHVASMNLDEHPSSFPCPDCGSAFVRLSTMQTHRYHHHGGPLPDTWAAEDSRVADEVEA